ncbi:MAG: hypothetical protein WDM79_17705 [Terricaulis sp.]
MAKSAAQARSQSAGLRFLSVLAALTPTPALAGAWIAPEGGQEIWSNAAGYGDEGQFAESAVYWEIPADETFALVAGSWVEDNAAASEEGWRAEATVALKAALIRNNRGAMAVQGGIVWRSEPGERGCSEAGAEARWLGGVSFGETNFVNLELGARIQDGGCLDQRLDLTAGYRPSPRWLAMAEIFVDEPDGGDSKVQGQITLVRFGDDDKGVQFGVRTRLDGKAQETAFVLGFWGRPGE